MKKILITTLALISILAPVSVFAAAAALDDTIAGPPKQGTINQFNAPVDTGTADSLVQQASVLGCSSTGGNGGSLSNSLGGALRGVGSNALQGLFGGGGFNSAADGGGGGGGGGRCDGPPDPIPCFPLMLFFSY